MFGKKRFLVASNEMLACWVLNVYDRSEFDFSGCVSTICWGSLSLEANFLGIARIMLPFNQLVVAMSNFGTHRRFPYAIPLIGT